MSSVPEDQRLPSGWLCRRAADDELILGHRQGGVEVVATRTDEADRLPFEPSGWDLTCRLRAGESTSECAIGRASTREKALSTLRSHMEDVSALIRCAGSAEGLCLTSIVHEIERQDGHRYPQTPSRAVEYAD